MKYLKIEKYYIDDGNNDSDDNFLNLEFDADSVFILFWNLEFL